MLYKSRNFSLMRCHITDSTKKNKEKPLVCNLISHVFSKEKLTHAIGQMDLNTF